LDALNELQAADLLNQSVGNQSRNASLSSQALSREPPLVMISLDAAAMEASGIIAYVAILFLPPVAVILCTLMFTRSGSEWGDVPIYKDGVGTADLQPFTKQSMQSRGVASAPTSSAPVARSNLLAKPTGGAGGLLRGLQRSQPSADDQPFLGVEFSGSLCPELTVPASLKTEATFFIQGAELTPLAQEVKIDVCRETANRESLLHLIVSESGRDKGILLETALEHSIAFLRTASAVRDHQGNSAGPQRFVKICRAAFDGGPYAPAFAVVMGQQEGDMRTDQHFVMWGCTPTGERGPAILQIYRVSESQLNAVDAQGVLIATMDERKTRDYRALRVGHGVDLALVMCAMTAAIKLS